MRPAILPVALLLQSLIASAHAEDAVEFDARRLFSCAEVKPPENADRARKVVVVVVPISANFNAEEKTVESLRYELRLPPSMTVLDHLPKTQTGTNIVGTIKEGKQETRITDLNVKFGAGGRVGFMVKGTGVDLGAETKVDYRDASEVKTNIQVDRLPPREQIIVAGTRDEGQTLYFDLKWHDQTTRAGRTDYVVLAEVDKDWTGDVATLVCSARSNGAEAGRLNKVVGLYIGGDNAARARMEKRLETARPTVNESPEILTTSIGLKLKRIPKGTFLMGAAPGEEHATDDERPQHRVTLSRPFYLGIYEVTQSEYKELMGENPSRWHDSDQQPVESMTRREAREFCNKLSVREGRKPYYRFDGDKTEILGGNGFRFPTEAEWEYACRAGADTIFPFGNDPAQLGEYAWTVENSSDTTHPVGRKKPNRWGLYDMLGNAFEMCEDEVDWEYYGRSPAVDPKGPPVGTGRSLSMRGGSAFNLWWRARPADRSSRGSAKGGGGFRIAADAD